MKRFVGRDETFLDNPSEAAKWEKDKKVEALLRQKRSADREDVDGPYKKRFYQKDFGHHHRESGYHMQHKKFFNNPNAPHLYQAPSYNNYHGQQHSQQPMAPKSNKWVRDKSNDICKNCGNKGHWAFECPQKA